MLKVTLCVYDKPDSVGGPVTWVQRLLPALRSRGIEARCLFLLHWGDSGPALTALRSQGFDCPAVIAHDRTEDRVRWILKRLAEDPPDVFVPNLVVAGYIAARWAKEAGIPTVGILHSDDEFYRGLQGEFVFGSPAARLSAVVCVSEELERQVRAAHPTPVVRRIPYGVPVPPTRVARSPGSLRIAYSGRLTEEQKKIAEVARAFIRAVKEIPDTKATIYGDGPAANDVERIVALEGAGLSVRVAGAVHSDRIHEKLLDCDAIVLLSDYEGLPIALMEGMACGCVPVCLATRSGIPELVKDRVTGLIVSDREDDFIRAIRELSENEELWHRLSTAARNLVELEFSGEICAARWAELLHELHRSAGPKKSIVVPRVLRLPPRNPALESEASRKRLPSLPVRLFQRGRIFAGALRRRAMGRPIP